MHAYRFSHLGDGELARDLARVTADRIQLAELLACLAEFDARLLYRPAGYPSMFAYCVGALGMSEDVASKRIYVARKARRFPTILPALADGRLHLTAVVMVGQLLTERSAGELLRDAEHRTKSELAELLARRFPQADVPTRIAPLGVEVSTAAHESLGSESIAAQHVPEHPEFPRKRVDPAASTTDPVAEKPPVPFASLADLAATGLLEAPVPAPVPTPVVTTALEPRPIVRPLAPERYVLQVTIAQGTVEKLRYFQDLLGHQVPVGDIAEALDKALAIAIEQLERRKFSANSRPRRGRRAARAPRTIPAAVRRAVWERDGGRCTFVGDTGHQCGARRSLEFDHVREFARGGEASVENIRLRCRAHNQYTAECTFGIGFMREKRERAG